LRELDASQRRSSSSGPSEALEVEVKLRQELCVGCQFTLSLSDPVLHLAKLTGECRQAVTASGFIGGHGSQVLAQRAELRSRDKCRLLQIPALGQHGRFRLLAGLLEERAYSRLSLSRLGQAIVQLPYETLGGCRLDVAQTEQQLERRLPFACRHGVGVTSITPAAGAMAVTSRRSGAPEGSGWKGGAGEGGGHSGRGYEEQQRGERGRAIVSRPSGQRQYLRPTYQVEDRDDNTLVAPGRPGGDRPAR
jgi:hypothetical protein